MVFRDDKDVLAQRLADLERDLKDAREGLDRKEEELRRLRERLGGLDRAPRPGRPLVLVGAAVAVMAVAIGGVWMTTVRRAPPRPLPPAAPEVPAPPPPPAPPPVAPPPAPEVAPPRPSAELVWKATVRSSRGTFGAIRAGSRCAIEVRATGGTRLDLDRVAVTCGDAVLYDSTAASTGTMMSQTGGSLRELPATGAPGRVYRLVYQDIGTRSLDARPQLEIGTERRIARVFHDGALGGALDLTVEPNSQPRGGEPLLAESGP